MTSIYDDLNPDWLPPELPGWEPWEPDEPEDVDPQACGYCGATEVRDVPDPYGGKPCCDPCFNLIIGGDVDDPPWRCGTPPLVRCGDCQRVYRLTPHDDHYLRAGDPEDSPRVCFACLLKPPTATSSSPPGETRGAGAAAACGGTET